MPGRVRSWRTLSAGRRRRKLLLDGADARVKLGDLLDGGGEGGAQQSGDAGVGVLQQQANLGDDVVGADRKWQAEFAEQAPDRIDPAVRVASQVDRGGARRPGPAGFRTSRDRVDILVAKGFEQTLGVGAVGLVTQHIGADHMRGHEDGLVAMGLGVAGPVVCSAARLHEDRRRGTRGQELPELLA